LGGIWAIGAVYNKAFAGAYKTKNRISGNGVAAFSQRILNFIAAFAENN